MDKAERLQMIEAMLAQNPNDSFLNYAAALELRKRGELDRATTLLEQLTEKDPDYLGTYYQLGKIYEANGAIENAIATYKNGCLVAKAQNDRKTLNELSEALMMLDEDF